MKFSKTPLHKICNQVSQFQIKIVSKDIIYDDTFNLVFLRSLCVCKNGYILGSILLAICLVMVLILFSWQLIDTFSHVYLPSRKPPL